MKVQWHAFFSTYDGCLDFTFTLHEECDRSDATQMAMRWLTDYVKHPDAWQLNDLRIVE